MGVRKRPAAAAHGDGADELALQQPSAAKPRRLDPRLKESAIAPGSIIEKFVQHAWEKLSAKQRQTLCDAVQVEARRTLSSACSGSGMAEVAHAVLMEMLGVDSKLVFSCEKESWKQRHLQECVHDKLDPNSIGCLFSDLSDLASGKGHCIIHSEDCEIKANSFLFTIGYSCKTLSKNSSVPKANILADGIGSSGETCHAMLHHIQACRPRVGLLENVDEMAKSEAESTNVEFLLNACRDLGYCMHVELFNSSKFHLPHERKRAFALILDYRAFGVSQEVGEDILRKILKLSLSFGSGPGRLSEWLLPASDPMLVAELQRRQSKSKSDIEKIDKGTGYIKKHQSFMALKGISWTRLQAPPSTANSPWYQVLPRREQEIIAMAMELEPHATMVTIQPSIDRAQWPSSGLLPTITTNSKYYLMYVDHQNAGKEKQEAGGGKKPRKKKPLDRLMLGWELLRAQGFPMSLIPQQGFISDRECTDLAGNAFSSTVVVSVMIGIYVYAQDLTASEQLGAGSLEEAAKATESDDMQGIAALLRD